MKPLHILLVPFDAGVEGQRMGTGLGALQHRLIYIFGRKKQELDNIDIVRVKAHYFRAPSTFG